jgi:hypothetical protein
MRPVPRRGLSHDEAFDSLPLFAADGAIGAMVLGSGREKEWREIAPLLEARGLPKIDPMMGGRYVPAVICFFDQQYGLNHGSIPLAPDGPEDFKTWTGRQKRRA